MSPDHLCDEGLAHREDIEIPFHVIFLFSTILLFLYRIHLNAHFYFFGLIIRIFSWTYKFLLEIYRTLLYWYADTSKPYTLYTDASKYGWAGVLTQPHITTIDGKSTTTDHPVAFVSGLFRGSQLNWAALTKEAFAIYMSIKKLSFYLTDAQILLRSDHKPLEKFLLKTR